MLAAVRAAVLTASLLVPAAALANGRLPGPTNLRFHPTDETRSLLGATFGLMVSTDGSASYHWVCENAIGYGGEYDPDYAFHPTRDEIWATTFEGLRVSKDGGCTWTSIGAPLDGGKWIGEVEIGSDGRVWAATSSGSSANDVYVSTDGETFTSVGLERRTGWWESIKIDPANPDHLWISGYQSEPAEDGYLYETIDGGTSWQAQPETNIVFGMDPRMMVLGVSPIDPLVVFIRVLNAQEPLGDAIYRTDDGGTTWTKVQQLAHAMRGFAISADGQTVYVGTGKLCADDAPTLPDGGLTQKGCLYKSTDAGINFGKAGAHPRLGPDNTPSTSNALAFGPGGDLYAGGSNPIDGFLIGRSTDGGASFSPVLKLNQIEGPLACTRGTAQAECAALVWSSLCVQLFICEDATPDAGPPAAADAGAGGGGGGGCCAVAPTRRGALLGGGLCAALVALVVGRRPRRRR